MGGASPLRLCWLPRQEDSGVLVGCKALGIGVGNWGVVARGSLGKDARGRLGPLGDGVPLRRSRLLVPPVWLEWLLLG